jgi:hypothetical protein
MLSRLFQLSIPTATQFGGFSTCRQRSIVRSAGTRRPAEWTIMPHPALRSRPLRALLALGLVTGVAAALFAAMPASADDHEPGGPNNGKSNGQHGLVFRVPSSTLVDADGGADADGVPDETDVCADTDLATEPDAPPKGLKPRRLWSTDEGFVNRSGEVVYSLAEAGGCSATQIIAAAGLGKGHAKHGISPGAMAAWVATLD